MKKYVIELNNKTGLNSAHRKYNIANIKMHVVLWGLLVIPQTVSIFKH